MSQVEEIQGIAVGDTVAYRWEIARNRGWSTRDLLRARGKVTGLEPRLSTVLCHVAWDRPGLPTMLGPQELHRIPADGNAKAAPVTTPGTR